MDISDRNPDALRQSDLRDDVCLVFQRASSYGYLMKVDYVRKQAPHPETGEPWEPYEWEPVVTFEMKPRPPE